MKILFLHGWTSVVGGRKPTYLQQQGHEVRNPALPDDDFVESVRIAEAEHQQYRPDVIVGSSRGAAVAMNMQSGDTPLVLLCPAWKNWGEAVATKAQTVILHSRQDDVIPFGDSEELVRNSNLPAEALSDVGNDHRLAEPGPLRAMLDACEQATAPEPTALDHPAISERYLFPQDRYFEDPFWVHVHGAELACYRRHVDPNALTMIHFHGNGEAVADYLPAMADLFADLGLNSLFVEYREYGDSTGKAQLSAMLGDGEAAMQAAGVTPARAIAFGRSIGSLYAIELARRCPDLAGLVLESSIADPLERFLQYADLQSSGLTEADIHTAAKQDFHHRKKLSTFANPLLVLHTEDDGLVDISHAERNYKWCAATDKTFVRFANGNHNTIFYANLTEYVEALKVFVEKIIA